MRTTLRLRTGAALVAAGAMLAGASCSQTVRTGKSSAYLIIEELRGINGADDSEDDTILASDVSTVVDEVCCSIFEDRGSVVFRLALRDTDHQAAVGPTDNNAITVTRFRVSYRRTDGRNTPGVDVPWPFEGASTVTVTDRAELTFVLVRLQAKLESPLIQLANDRAGLGGAGAISTIADVTFFGRDQVGNDVSVTGSISVNFADWADPE